MATIYDKEIVLYIASLMAAKLEAGEDVAQDFVFTAHDLFSVTGSNHSARSYGRLSEALERVAGRPFDVLTSIKVPFRPFVEPELVELAL